MLAVASNRDLLSEKEKTTSLHSSMPSRSSRIANRYVRRQENVRPFFRPVKEKGKKAVTPGEERHTKERKDFRKLLLRRLLQLRKKVGKKARQKQAGPVCTGTETGKGETM